MTYLENKLKDHSAFQALSREEYNGDRSKRRDVERWIENIINSSVDMAKIILHAEARPLPDTYREVVKNLSLVEGFDGALLEKLSSWVSLRNVISHEYLDIRWSSIKKFIREAQPFYEKFSEAAKGYLAKNGMRRRRDGARARISRWNGTNKAPLLLLCSLNKLFHLGGDPGDACRYDVAAD